MRYLAMIQARVNSSRLKNKIFLEANQKPMLQHVIERVQQSKSVDEVMVVTSIEKSNLPVLSLCATLGVRVFVGSESDVLDRYYQAARILKPNYVIRITGDCPLFDGSLLDTAIMEMQEDTDYLGMLSETFADGLDLEIIKFSALKKAWTEARKQSEREHVTQYILHHPDIFTLQDFISPIGYFGEKRWTLDELEDYKLILNIIDYFSAKKMPNFTYKDVLQYIDENPELNQINAKYSRNEGLTKSLANDYVVEGVGED
jgi:spore coat polysaccharide biosynthesis protein SpsF (cytidylyltransferase family)